MESIVTAAVDEEVEVDAGCVVDRRSRHNDYLRRRCHDDGIEVVSLSGKRTWREDHIQTCDFYQGITTHKNAYDFATISPVEVISTKQAMKPPGTKLFDWIGSWKV